MYDKKIIKQLNERKQKSAANIIKIMIFTCSLGIVAVFLIANKVNENMSQVEPWVLTAFSMSGSLLCLLAAIMMLWDFIDGQSAEKFLERLSKADQSMQVYLEEYQGQKRKSTSRADFFFRTG